MSFAFKRFNFFQQNEVPNHSYPRNSTCFCLGSSLLFVGCDNGSVHALDESLQTDISFTAHSYKVFEVIWLEVGHSGEIMLETLVDLGLQAVENR